jgi:DNA repair photolyase
VVRAARDAGATRIWAHFLYLKEGTREHFMKTLEKHWPEERERYEKIYSGRAYLPKSEGAALSEQISTLKKRYAVRDRRVLKLVPPEPTEQLELAI